MKNIIKPERLYLPTLLFLMLYAVSGIAQSTFTGVSKIGDRLSFSSKESLDAAIATLESQVNRYVDTRPDPQEGEYFDPNPPLGDFERSLGFNSLRVKALNFEFDQLRRGVDPADLVEYSWLMDDVLASLVNENHVLQIGSDIYIAKPQGYIRIPNQNEATLTAIIRGESPGAFPGVEVAGDGEVGGGDNK